MEIKNEIKAKVFAQYLGHKVITGYRTESKKGEPLGRAKGELREVDLHDNCMFGILLDGEADKTHYHYNLDWKLILKPLSSISDDDAQVAIKIYKVLVTPDGHITEYSLSLEKIKRALIGVTNQNGGRADAYQYLQSRGYDLPNYLLGGKTLNEAGLCIYE